MTNSQASEEESYDYSYSGLDEDFKFECSADDDFDEEDTADYLSPTTIPKNEVKNCDQIIAIEFPSLESLTKDQPVEMEPIYFDKYKLIPQFVVDSEIEYTVFCYLKCDEPILLDISLYIPSLEKVAYNRYCAFSKTTSAQRLTPALFSSPEIPTEPIPNAYFSIHKTPSENLCRQFFNCIGLVNPCMTCYLNSLIQCLFYLKKFREIVFNCNTTSLGKKSKIANAMRVLFTRMQLSYVPVSTRDLTTAFGWDGNDLFQQHDVQELTRILLARLDDVTENSASSLFKGKNEETIIAGQFKKSHIEEFSDLSLTVNGVSSLEESLDKYYEPDKLTGDDQYQLEDGTKVDAEVHTKVIENPIILSLHLRRFEYSTEMTKVYSRFEYKEDLIFNGEEYELLSIIAHNGSVGGGHYNAFVKIDGKWTNFDDECVRHCETYEALDQNFGCDKKGQFTAYVLFYGKKGVNDIGDPQPPEDIIENEKERLSNIKITIFYDDLETWKDIKVKKSLDSKSFIDVLSKETGIPSDKIVVKIFGDHDSTQIFQDPVPITKSPLYIDDSSLLPIWVWFWIPEYEKISLGTFHITQNVDTPRMLGQEILRKVGMISQNTHTLTAVNNNNNENNEDKSDAAKIDLECFFYLFDDKEYILLTDAMDKPIEQSCSLFFQFAGESANVQNFALFKENVLKKKEEKIFKNSTVIEESKLPQHESHLNLLADEIKINDFNNFNKYMNDLFNLEFIPFDDPENEDKKFVLSLSKHLSFEQLLKCISRKLSGDNEEPVDINRILFYLPDKYFCQQPSHRPINKEVFNTIEQLPESYDCLYYEVHNENMQIYNRADVTIIDSKGNKMKRLPILFPRGGKNTINELRAKLTEELGFCNYYLYYVKDYMPIFIYSLIENEDEKKNYGESEIIFDYKIFAQVFDVNEIMKIKHISDNNEGGATIDYRILDEEDVLKLRVLRCDQLYNFYFSPHLPFILFTEKGKKWKDIKEMFPNEEIEIMKQNSKVTTDDEKEMNEDDAFAIIHTKNFNSFYLGENSLLKIKNEIDEFKNELNREEEEEEEQAEEEEEAEEEKFEKEEN